MKIKTGAQAGVAARDKHWGVTMAMALATCLTTALAPAWAATPASGTGNTATAKADKPAATGKATPAAKAKQADPGYRIAPIPAWVQEPPAGGAGAPAAPPVKAPPGFGGALPPAGTATPTPGLAQPAATAANATKARRDQLLDTQVNLTGKTPVMFIRTRSQALDSSTLREVSEPQLQFNPDYQRLVIHQVAVLRDGQRLDRTQGVRVEIMRREQQLERQMLDGLRTALVMLSDVRVGDAVEVAYSIEGSNPIFEGHFSDLFQLAGDAPIDRIFLRIEAPAGRTLQTKGIGGDVTVERQTQGGHQVLTLFRQNVPAVLEEPGVPPWFKVYPAIHVSDYQSWDEVDHWARGLFAQEAPTGELAQRIADWKAKGLAPEALVAEVLRFVQDDVRYFSLSLGESSHRPKPASRTLAERLGDCKDKVLLLNTLLTGLGFEAQPALVSTHRNRGIQDYLPSHDEFDHVISRVVVDGKPYFLDATMNGQGYDLRNRGYYPYGQALVVGAGQGLQPVVPPDFAVDAVAFRQQWDLSDLRQPARLDTVFIARGLAAERWRSYVAAAGLDRLQESVGGLYVRQYPGLKPSAPAELKDSRETNELEMTLHFTTPTPGQLQNASMVMDLPMFELTDMFSAPNEARRRTPFMLDQPRLADATITLLSPNPLGFKPPPARQITDPRFNFSMKMEVDGPKLLIQGHYERRADEVLPADLDTYRDRASRARQLTGTRMGFSLVDAEAVKRQFGDMEKRVARYGGRMDGLNKIIYQQEFVRVRDTLLLHRLDATSVLAQKALAERAQAYNMLGEPALGLKDADASLALNDRDEEALEARGVALVSLGRAEEALDAFDRQAKVSTRGPGSWLAVAQYQLGRYDEAERGLRELAQSRSGDERQYALLWLALANERKGAGQGAAVIEDDARKADTSVWSSQLLRYMAGQIDRKQLLKAASEKPEEERLRQAEAYFFIGQQLAAQGKRADAMPWFEKVLTTQAVPYREYMLASQEVKRGAGR